MMIHEHERGLILFRVRFERGVLNGALLMQMRTALYCWPTEGVGLYDYFPTLGSFNSFNKWVDIWNSLSIAMQIPCEVMECVRNMPLFKGRCLYQSSVHGDKVKYFTLL